VNGMRQGSAEVEKGDCRKSVVQEGEYQECRIGHVGLESQHGKLLLANHLEATYLSRRVMSRDQQAK
jgi:hypothetical protein